VRLDLVLSLLVLGDSLLNNMQLIVLIPSFLVFLYFLYKLVKDDYVFIRKNISLEQIFDIAFVVLFVSLFFSRFFFLLFHFDYHQNPFLSFFTPGKGGFSFFGLIIGVITTLYLIGKYKKIPLGRLFDFFTLAIVVALPLGYFSSAFLLQGFSMASQLVNAIVYFIFAVFCVKYVHPKLTSRELKEGNLQILFLLFFSVVSLINVTMLSQKGKIVLVSIESITLVILFLISTALFIRQSRSGFINKRR
jgi:hypothetical protein